jgi:hypothetical protein
MESWIASLRASRVSRSVERAEGMASRMSSGFGLSCLESLKSASQESSSLKTLRPYALGTGGGSSATLPHAGLLLHGIYFPREASEPTILARDSSFSPQNGTAWTTPCADDVGLRKSKYAQGGKPLSLQVREYCRETLGYEASGQNPDFRDALMGLPIGWTDCERPAMESFQKWRRERGESCPGG